MCACTFLGYDCPIPFLQTGCNTRSIFMCRKASLDSEFSFFQTSCLTKAKEPSLPKYLLIAVVKTNEFISFTKTLAQSEIQTASRRIWTWVTNSITYVDKHYAKHVYSCIYNANSKTLYVFWFWFKYYLHSTSKQSKFS